ncbi:DJ-1/PfpI family protein [Roseibium sp. MMSF_3544]|uniref:DJ-1/PfpI family protein n=1 Tax=unclassified Roseibium TaxID=2629323 RepID=UPI00273FAB56|nr:DJ-1/PfpI family protein [Roseibium sp. MMSF_3544]
MNRRKVMGTAAAAASGIALMSGAKSASAHEGVVQRSMVKLPPMHNQRKPEVAMLLYPGVTLLDLLGPQTVLAPSCNVHVIWKNTDLLETDSGIIMKATSTLDECPKDLDVLFVPGGEFSVMTDPVVLTFLADRGARARYVTSVCGGSIVLGAAGLLKGYRATSHWAAKDQLHLFGATPQEGRVVRDRNRISGGGVTAGIDFGLVLLAELLGEDVAKLSQLALEYDPAPPFDAGTPEKAGPVIMDKMRRWLGPAGDTLTAMCTTAAANMGQYTPLAK